MRDTLEQLRSKNLQRCEESFQSHGGLNGWNPAEWACAMAGEVGEACNLIKKLNRGDSINVEDIGKELADVIIYADLLAARLGIDLCTSIRKKFNEVSDRVGSPIKMAV